MDESSKIKFNLGMFTEPVEACLRSWHGMNYLSRLRKKDPKLWFPEPTPELSDRLGWLELPAEMGGEINRMEAYAHRVKKRGIEHILLLGMGGSSLAPEMFFRVFGNKSGFPDLTVLDSTHPDAVINAAQDFDLEHTLFLVSSKSGTTLETLSLFRYFWGEMSNISSHPGRHFTAITDPGSDLAMLAEARGFDAVFCAPVNVGGRFSALSYFGMVPAALIGLDITKLLAQAQKAVEENLPVNKEEASVGLRIGAALAEIGPLRDKLTFLTSPSLTSFPDWLEQLLAESLGKEGKGVIPIAGEPGVLWDCYGEDRFFVIYRIQGDDNVELDVKEGHMRRKGFPVIVLPLTDRYEIGRELFRWEVAVAAAGSALGIHPFNQPDVQLTKNLTRSSMDRSQPAAAQPLTGMDEYTLDDREALQQALAWWLDGMHPDHYIAIQAYLLPAPEIKTALNDLRLELLRKTELATTLGLGPRFLHSTGQIHKGGPDTGLFLQLVDRPETKLAVPETDFTFSELIDAQAKGDYMALKQRGRRVLRINLEKRVLEGLEKLKTLIY